MSPPLARSLSSPTAAFQIPFLTLICSSCGEFLLFKALTIILGLVTHKVTAIPSSESLHFSLCS